MFKWMSSLFSNKEGEQGGEKSPYASVKVWFDENNVWVWWPEKEPQSVAWKALIGVAVETTDEGPLV